MASPPANERQLGWEGLLNGRDLVGLAVPTGLAGERSSAIVAGRLVRSGSTHLLTAAGWRDLVAYGVTTIVDLRSGPEARDASVPDGLQPESVDRVACSLEPPGFIEGWRARPDRWKLTTPHYYPEFAASYPERIVAALQSVATAPPGGVVIHCSAGRDRCGLAVAMMLDLIGVDHADIIADHWLSYDRSESLEAALGRTPSPEAAALTKAEHHELLGGFLQRSPADSLFDDPAAVEATRRLLLERLVG